MFERFTHEARDVVVGAQLEARALGHNWIGTEHLLLAVLTQREGPARSALDRLGVTEDAFRAEVLRVCGHGGFAARDADALRTLGIDLDEVRRRVEKSFGPGALDRSHRVLRTRRRRLPWRRRRCDEARGHIPFAPRAKRALERALREALALQDRHIGVEHVLLGLLDPKGNLAVELLDGLGVDPQDVRRALLSDLGKAA